MCGVHPGDLTRWLLFPKLVTVGELVELAVLVVVRRVVVERSSLLFGVDKEPFVILFQSENFVDLRSHVSRFTTIDKIKFILVLFYVKCKVECTHIFMTIGANRYPYGHIS